MNTDSLQAVTGAFGYIGRYIARSLLAKGHEVITLTNSPSRSNPFGNSIKAHPYDFDSPDKLTKTLQNVSVLYNTYWVRFNHKLFKHADAIENSKTLFEAAAKAGVKRIVHVSVTNPSEDTDLEYYRGKAVLERALKDTGVPHTILRPTLVFGKEDILINNIAWLLRKTPVFGVFGRGDYRLQPIFAEDLAEIAAACGKSQDNQIINCNGPETFTYRSMVETVAEAIGKKRLILSIPPTLAYLVGKAISPLMNDIIITRAEIEGLMRELLYVDTEPVGTTKFSDWIKQNADSLGRGYSSELARRKDRVTDYWQTD